MDNYVTGSTIRMARRKKGITQSELADIIGVDKKTVSKWETAKGLPDINLLQPLAGALVVSVMELMSGDTVTNKNVSANILRSSFYVCPLCGNILYSTGDALISCCGATLTPLKACDEDAEHEITVQRVEDEHFITVRHPMTKEHYISCAAFVTCDSMQFKKLYPEGDPDILRAELARVLGIALGEKEKTQSTLENQSNGR